MTFNFITKVINLMTKEERHYAFGLIGLIFIMAVLDVLGVASIMPFISIVTNPTVIDSNPFLNNIFHTLNFNKNNNLLLIAGVTTFILLLISIIFKSVTSWAILRFNFMCEYSLGNRLLSGYLHQPYEWFLSQHSASLGKALLSEIEQVVNGYFLPLMQTLAQGLASLFILFLLILVDPLLAFYVFSTLGISYILIFLFIKKRLTVLGSERLKSNELRFKVITEIFGGIKEIKVGCSETFFAERYSKHAKLYAHHQVIAKTMFLLPRYVMEAIAFGGMLLITIYLIGFTHNYQAALPILGLYAIAGYRLMPALQQIFAYISQLRFTYPMLLNLHDEYFNLSRKIVINKKKSPIKISHYIELVNVSYKFPQSKSFSLNGVNIKIPIKSSIGFVGVTGAGKTTTVDVLMGLLKPQKGTLKIDGKFLSTQDSSSWSEIISYVPQNIFLSDDTIIANIAFGIPEKDINFNSIKKAAQQANLSDFIEKDLPDGYFTKIGERGVRLSGGQRQRIGIARALYRDPQVLVFDEATSALDNITEDIVMQAIQQLSKKMTVILIAHRLSTVSACNKIYLFENGSILDEGNYNELFLKSEKFREMALIQKNKQIKTNISEGVNHE